MSEREIPACVDLAYERRYLGALMADAAVADEHPLDASDLWLTAHRTIAKAALALAARKASTDPSSVATELHRTGGLESCGGRAAVDMVASLIELYPAPIVQRLRELATARRALEHARRAQVLIEGGDIPEGMRELREGAEVRMPCEAEESRFGTARIAVTDAIQELHNRRQMGRPAFVQTGMAKLDELIGGTEYGDVNVLGADSGVGKSTTALLMALGQAANGHRPGYITCEDSRLRVGRRIASALSGVPAKALRVGDLSPWQWEALSGAVARVCESELHCAWCEGESLGVVEEAMRVLIYERGCDVIYLDYLQAVEPHRDHPNESPKDHMRRVMATVRRVVSKAPSPPTVWLLSQVRKMATDYDAPKLSDLYESNYIRQKADSIVLLWRDEDGTRHGVYAKGKDGDGKEGERFTIRRDDFVRRAA